MVELVMGGPENESRERPAELQDKIRKIQRARIDHPPTGGITPLIAL